MTLLIPPRRRGVEFLDDPATSPELLRRSLRDVARSNALFGGTRAVLAELDDTLDRLPREATLLDVGTGIADIPARAQALALRRGIALTTFGLDGAEALAAASRSHTSAALCADALRLPFGDRAVDVVLCSQVLHHFADEQAAAVLREMHRVARVRVIVADLRRSWLAAAGIWLASFPLRFHPVSRHDGVVSVFRGYTVDELRELVRRTTGCVPRMRTRWAFRVTASWSPAP